MSNVIALKVPNARKTKEQKLAAIIASFATQRRFGDDVFWLKENAELLNILECTGAELGSTALVPHETFYENIEKRMGFCPNTTGSFCRYASIWKIWACEATKAKRWQIGWPAKV